MLCRVFTYHQVCPSYLNFITCLAGATEVRFGGFRARQCLRSPVSPMKILNRSGYHYQFSFRVYGVLAFPSHETHPFRFHTSAIYHQFDVHNGTALWIMASPIEADGKNYLWSDIRDSIHLGEQCGQQIVSSSCIDRFEGSVLIVAAIADWSMRHWPEYAHSLENNLREFVSET